MPGRIMAQIASAPEKNKQINESLVPTGVINKIESAQIIPVPKKITKRPNAM